jgi:hypothetical protein
MRALEDYNEYARGEMRELNRRSQRLDETGEAHVPAELVQEVEKDERRQSAPELGGLKIASPTTLDVDMGGMAWTAGGSASGAIPASVNLSRDPRLRR